MKEMKRIEIVASIKRRSGASAAATMASAKRAAGGSALSAA